MTVQNMTVENSNFDAISSTFINIPQDGMPTEIDWQGTDELKLLLQDDRNTAMWIRADANDANETQGPSLYLTQDNTSTGGFIGLDSSNSMVLYSASSASNLDGRFKWYTSQLSGANSTTLPTFSTDILLMDLNDSRLLVNTAIEYAASEDVAGTDVITVDGTDQLNILPLEMLSIISDSTYMM